MGGQKLQSLNCTKWIASFASRRFVHVMSCPSFSIIQHILLQRVDHFSCCTRTLSRVFYRTHSVMVHSVSMERKTKKSFTLSDGTVLPPNTFVSAAAGVTHMDEANYPHALDFDGLRFANLRKESKEENRYQLVSLDLEFMGYGNGRDAW
jgi:hypothetical protein